MRNPLLGVILALLAVAHSAPADPVTHILDKPEDEVLKEVLEDGYLIEETYPRLLTTNPPKTHTAAVSQQPTAVHPTDAEIEGSALGDIRDVAPSMIDVLEKHDNNTSLSVSPAEEKTEDSGSESATESPTQSESATESGTKSPAQPESGTESCTELGTESGTESPKEPESATELGTESPKEPESGTESPTQSESTTESGMESVRESWTESWTELGSGFVFPTESESDTKSRIALGTESGSGLGSGAESTFGAEPELEPAVESEIVKPRMFGAPEVQTKARHDLLQEKDLPKQAETAKANNTPGWMIIVGFIVGLAALVMLCVAIATRDKWNGPRNAAQLEARTGPSGQQRELEMTTLVHKESPKENGKAAEYTVIPLDELPDSYSSH